MTPPEVERMGAREREMLEAARVADMAMIASTSGIPLEAISEVSEKEEERSRAIQERKDTISLFTYETSSGKIRLDDTKIAEWVRLKYHALSFAGVIYTYENGIYHENGGEIEAEIQRIANLTECRESITRLTKEVIHRILFTDPEDDYPFNNKSNLIPVENGAIEINYDTGEVTLLPPSPEHRFSLSFPVRYDPQTDPEAFHREVIGRYIDENQAEALYQIPACAILQMQGKKPYKRAYILQGDKNAGKTTYLEILYALFGWQNIAGASLHQIGLDRFVNSTLEHKILNVYDDLDDVPLANIGPFKTLTGGFDHTIEKKHRDPYRGRIFALHVFSCNSPPEVPERVTYDPAFWGRWIYLNFENVFDVDPDFMAKFVTPENLSAFLNRVIQTMIKIKREGLIVAPDESTTKQAWSIAADPFARFVSEEMTSSQAENFFEKEVLLKSFIRWCEDRQIPGRKIPTTMTALSQRVFKNEFRTTQKNRREVYGARKIWRSGSTYQPTQDESASGINYNLQI